MSAGTTHAAAKRYWTPSRCVAGGLIALIGLGTPGYFAWRVLGGGDALPLRAQRDLLAEFDASNLLLDRLQIRAGGPAKDGIPALVNPAAVAANKADFLKAADRVVGVTVNGQSRAYPIAVLNWHEAINDTIGGVPIAVIYCPLCDSVSVVDRRLGSKTYTFGISGLLYNSNVLLYDRTDNALWSQVKLTAVSGPNAGKSLKHLPWEITTFDAWKKAQPGSTVVSFDTGHRRDYRTNPYADYFSTDRLMFPVEPKDDRLRDKEVVVGVKVGNDARAYPLKEIRRQPGGVVRDTLGGQTIVLQADASGEVKVLEAPEDAQVVHTFWFAWAAFHPQAGLFKPPRTPARSPASRPSPARRP